MHTGSRALIVVSMMIFASAGRTLAQAPTITSISPNSGALGTSVALTGTNFGASQGTSTISLNGTSAVATSWSATSITAVVPTGASSGRFSVVVARQTVNSSSFTVTALPSGWSDQDVGTSGSGDGASYSNGVFTVNGSGSGEGGSADAFNFAYQSLSGDGTIIARLASSNYGNAGPGIMIRETLNANAEEVSMVWWNSNVYFSYRSSTGGSTSQQHSSTVSLPYWVKLVRSGNTFSGYIAPDGVNWTQFASSQTVTMAHNVYIGMLVSGNGSNTGIATFDNVSAGSAAPVLSNISATTASVGSQVGISGSNFGNGQGSGVVTLKGSPVQINSWTNTAIVLTVPTGAASGPLQVFAGPTMNATNSVYLTVTSQPLPPQWLDTDIGGAGGVGSASYANGTFTLSGLGVNCGGYSDFFHMAYQPMSGDGSVVARVVSVQGGSDPVAGVIIRETLGPASTYLTADTNGSYPGTYGRTSTGGGGGCAWYSSTSISLPYWLKVVRTGSTFTAYDSPDGVNWTQIASSTINMAQNVYVGLATLSDSWSITSTATFDNVSINMAPDPSPVITNVSATTGSVGGQVTITGSNFGATQGSSVVTLHGTPLTINFWSATTIVGTIPSGATSGLLVVSVGPDANDSNPVYFTVTSQPLPVGWLDIDIGSDTGIGSATYANGTFTVSGVGSNCGGSSDLLHMVYQPLSGDGSVSARLVSIQGGSSPVGGVIIRETLGPAAAYLSADANTSNRFTDGRTTTGGGSGCGNYTSISLPYWLKVVRSGSTFSAYGSSDGVNWTQIGGNQTSNMAQNIYLGLIAFSGSYSSTTTATFDNVSVTVGTTPYLSGMSPTIGGVGTSVTIAGSNFGATQGGSTVTFNGVAATVTSWTSSQIVASVPAAVPSGTGSVVVTVNSIPSVPTFTFTAIKPVITSLAPPAAPIGGTVILNGSGFGSNSSGSSVQFNGVAATITSWSDTSISATVPANTTSGSVAVIEDGYASNSASFTVIESLGVTGLAPAIGPVGTTVTISGAGFGQSQSNSVASFYGVPANIVSWSDTSIVTTVPVGASTGNVSVMVAGNTVYGPPFTLTSGLTLTDSLGDTTTYNSQVVSGVWEVTNSTGSGCSTCTQRGTISKTYDGQGNVLTDTNENGHTRTYTYDGNGNVLTVSEPDGNGNTLTTIYTYNSFNEVLTVTDPLGFVTTNTYDSHGNLQTVTTPKPDANTAASVTQFGYNSLGQLTAITDPLNHVTNLGYTLAGLIQTITDAQNHVTTYGYDTHGNRTSVTDALNHQTTFTYDPMDRLTKITYPDSTTTQFGYDTRGRRTSVTDQNGKVTQYAYDDADRLTTVTDAANNVTTYGYDTEDNLTSIKDANNNTTTFTPDAFGRITKTTFPSGYIEQYNYDAVGNLTSKTDRKNQQITYTFDQLNRLTKKSYPDSSAVNYTYDLDSRLTQVTDPTGTYQFTFDNMGRLTGTTTNYTFLTARTFTSSYGYDAASNRTGFTDPENGATAYVYDTLNRLQTLTPPTAFTTGSFGFGYDALSRRTQMTRPNNITTNYSYDNLSHLLSVLHQSGSTTLDGASYVPDNAGNRTSKTDQHSGVTSNYAYDPIYELTKVMQGTNTTENYTYDPVGNRLSSLNGSYTYNISNELTTGAHILYSYDYNGNIITQANPALAGPIQYTWDFENHLTSVTLPPGSGSVSFKYDPFGRRIQKSFTTGANPPTTTTASYLYDGGNLIEEVDPNGNVVSRYAQGLNIDEPLVMLRSAASSYYNLDAIGSVTSLSNAAGSLAQTYTYDSFGKRIASSGSLTNPFQYTGREFDSETSLYYYRARYYDQSAGRFITEDPLKSVVRLNKYKYANNSPVILTDPSGLREECTFNGTQRISPWHYTLNIIPTSSWHFVMSFAEGPEKEGLVPWEVVTCIWERKVTKEQWKTAIFLLSWNCKESFPCGATRYRIKYSARRQTELFSRVTDFRDTTSTTFYGGPQDDEANDVSCVLSHRPLE